MTAISKSQAPNSHHPMNSEPSEPVQTPSDPSGKVGDRFVADLKTVLPPRTKAAQGSTIKRFGSAQDIVEQHTPSEPIKMDAVCEEMFQPFPEKELKEYPRKTRNACGEQRFAIEDLKYFTLKRRWAGVNYRVREGKQLMRHQAHYRLANFFFDSFTNPEPGLKILIEQIQQRNGGEKITVVLDSRVIRGPLGSFSPVSRGKVFLYDNLSKPKHKQSNGGVMDHATLNHEMGHHLMYLLYGKKFPSYEGHEGHDLEAETYFDSQTNLGAAWSEGFANAMGNLDGGSAGGRATRHDVSDDWLCKSLKARLSNEYVIEAVLTDYIMSRHQTGPRLYQVVLDQESEKRLQKIFHCMEVSGRQKSFQDFMGDFYAMYPEEAGRLDPLLRTYGLSELTLNESL